MDDKYHQIATPEFSGEKNTSTLTALVDRYENMVKKQKSEYFDISEVIMLADHYVQNHAINTALDLTQYGRTIHKTCEELLYQEANLLLASHRPSEALSLLNTTPLSDFEDMLFIRSQCYLMLNNLQLSTNCFDKLLNSHYAQSKNSGHIILYFSQSLLATDRPTVAIPYLKRLLDQEPKNSTAIDLLCQCYRLTNNFEELVTILSRLVDQDACNDKAWTLLGIAFGQLANTSKAIHALECAIALNPNNHEAHQAMANIFLILEKADLALEHLDLALNHANNDQRHNILCDIGHIYHLQKEYGKALTSYIYALQENPYSCYEYMEIARIFVECPNLTLSEIDLDIRPITNTLNLETHKSSSDTEELLDDIAQDIANKSIENLMCKAIALDLQNEYDFLYFYGYWLTTQQRQKEALGKFREQLESNKHHVATWLALSELIPSEIEKIALLQSAVHYNFDDAPLHLRLAACYYLNNDTAQALYYLELGLQKDSTQLLHFSNFVPQQLDQAIIGVIQRYCDTK